MPALVRTKSFLLACLFLLAFDTAAWDRGHVDRFATLPDGAAAPEGIAVDGNGNVYVSTFATGAANTHNLYVFNSHGRLLKSFKVPGSSTQLLGMAFHPTSGLLVVDFGGAKVFSVNPDTEEASTFATIPGGASAGPNALAFDAAGNVYISDSFQGIIWRTPPAGVTATAWATSDLLKTAGVPPFGANGLDFSGDHRVLFVANTGNDTIVRIPVDPENGSALTAAVFVNSVNGADGLFVDDEGNIWVCANQADEIVVIDPTGRVIAKLGDFEGVRRQAPVGLLFPASLVRHGNWVYVTNLSLDLRLFGLPQAVDSQWAADVKRHTISRIRARIPRVERGDD